MAGQQQEEGSASGEESLHELARLAFHSFRRQLERETIAHGVSPGQWRFLRQLWDSNGICQHSLATALAISDATATISLREMEKKGLVVRRRNAGNRREMLIFLTPRGSALQNNLLPITRDLHIRATQNMRAAEVMALERLLRRVIANLDHGSRAAK